MMGGSGKQKDSLSSSSSELAAVISIANHVIAGVSLTVVHGRIGSGEVKVLAHLLFYEVGPRHACGGRHGVLGKRN